MVLDDGALAHAVGALNPTVEPVPSPTHPRLLAALARPEYCGRVVPPRKLYER